MKFATFFYPGYYQCPVRNAAAGCIVDEWEILKRDVKSVFVRTEPVVPALGYTDCSDPIVLAREASLAAAHGIDAFIFNFYFDGEHEELSKPLETFCSVSGELQFAINICCHMPKRKLPFGIKDVGVAPLCQLSVQEFEALAYRLSDKFFCSNRYLRHTSRVVVTLYHVVALVLLYGPTGLRERLDRFRCALSRRGVEVYLVGLFSVVGGWKQPACALDDLPFDGYSCYVALPDFESREAVQSFDAAAAKSLAGMASYRTGAGSLIVCAGAGWNATARGAAGYDPIAHGLAFPYYPVIVDDHPKAFERYLRRAVNLAQSNEVCCRDLLFLGPWNEWTEGCYLLPDARYGTAKLEAVRRVKADLCNES
ncbi:hypothetical protein R69658_07279 [Paraburkholderia aspalathi]|uniref:Glycosyltransferase WbsX n=1 Tax=Paraburkholderia aspalathi TaxID=1324617 RepID=A0ABN7NBQ8_9BURK|nr:glycoside hydrolase family 99-like domain-containing protein [Paraburkholderia aspalathi]MBK3823605.1 hypothetical protein [Paraburkholderia aspalathi]MBK3835438.1 hypothetical protein [Paraburkholderia aspalathi]MBK3865198.1 hypothetical protein [Paraburkholderia aspalathi]CAE6853514.1 hypothetical protein R69658_07279 [Paraburkholderia aspalathi]